jgi:hypothetical protein
MDMQGDERTCRDIEVNVGMQGIQGNTREYRGIQRKILE